MSAFHNIQLVAIDSCGSTNEEILNYRNLQNDATILISKEQTNGRGQRGKTWKSPNNGNWYFSLLIQNLDLHLDKIYAINWTVVEGILNYFLALNFKNIQLKWPNDIFSEKGKIGGILIENQLVGEKIKSSIIGIGINRYAIEGIENQNLGVSSLEQEGVTNLKDNQSEILDLANSILKNFNEPLVNYNHYFNNIRPYIYGINKKFAFQKEETIFEAKVLGVDEQGKLILINNKQEQLSIQSGSLIWLNEI